jgi:hypothetical protein
MSSRGTGDDDRTDLRAATAFPRSVASAAATRPTSPPPLKFEGEEKLSRVGGSGEVDARLVVSHQRRLLLLFLARIEER